MGFNRGLKVVECRTGGMIGRVVIGGFGDVPGETVYEKMRYIEHCRDDVRQLLLPEPRGAAAVANIVVPSNHPDAAMGYVIAESTEYPAMSGRNTITTATVLLETGMVPMSEPVTELALEAPAGLIRLRCECADGKVTGVTFTNQPAFVHHLDAPIEVEGLDTVTVDVAWGGLGFVLADAAALGFALTPDESRDLRALGQRLTRAAAAQLDAVHPEHPDFPGITHAEFTGPLRRDQSGPRARAAVVVSTGRLDPMPCGTGTSARLAVLHARGEIAVGERFVQESLAGSESTARIESLTTVGGRPAVVPSVTGPAPITELNQIDLDC